MTVLPTWDLFITLFFVIGIAYGLILQKDKTILTIISTYAALIVVNAIAPTIQSYMVGEQNIMGQVFIKSNTNLFTIKSVIFILIIALVSTKSGLSGKDTGGVLSPIELFAYSFFSTMLVIASIFSFMTVETRTGFAASSKIASLIMQYEVWWVVLPVVLLIITGFMHKSE